MSTFLAKAAAFALSFFAATKEHKDNATMDDTFKLQDTFAPAQKPLSIYRSKSSNGIQKTRNRKHQSSPNIKLTPSAKVALLVSTLEEKARLATHTPMTIVTSSQLAFDTLKEQYRKHFLLFETWRTEASLTLFDNEHAVAKEVEALKEILDDFELANISVPEEIWFVQAWQTWYMREVVEFLEGNAVSEGQRELKKVVKKMVWVLERAHSAACSLGMC